jgi:DNA-binding CsgD family transcriptional regulator
MREAAQAARNAPPTPGEPRAVDVLLDGLALRFTEGYVASAPSLKAALARVRDADGSDGQDVRWPWTARRVAPDLFDDDTWHALATRNVQLAREAGALAVLPLALNYLSLLCCFKGELAAASSLVEEADVIAEATRTPRIGFARVLLAACRGDEKKGLAQIEACEAAAAERKEGVVLTFGEHARALLYNGLGRHAEALGPARSASARDELMVSVWALAELVEAAARCGESDIASDAMEQLSARTQAAGTDLALGIEARGRALVSDGAGIEEFHCEAVDRLGRTRLALELARSHLLYGEWLRRQNRRIDAREQLRTAHEMFTSMSATAFADRASRELLATGETVRARRPDLRDELTPQEVQIAELARDGLTNPEIGARLFLSPRTVQYHLGKVFAKLDLKSRHELENALPGSLAD